MSNPYNTDGMLLFPPNDAGPVTDNAFESIECAIAFDVRDWSEDRRSTWIYAIVFGWDNDDAWECMAKKFGWNDEDRKRAAAFHEQWEKAKEMAVLKQSAKEFESIIIRELFVPEETEEVTQNDETSTDNH